MALKATVQTLDDVPEAFRSEYQEQDGKFVLNVEDPDTLPNVANLKSAYERVKASSKDTSAKLADALAKLEAKPNPTAKDDADIIKLREALEGDRDKWRADAEALQAKVHSLTVGSQLDAAILGAGITNPTAIKAARKLLADGVKVDGDNAYFDSDMGPLDVGKYVKAWAAGEGAFFVNKPAGGGAAGAKDSGSVAKEIRRAEFDAMNATDRAKAISSGANVVD